MKSKLSLHIMNWDPPEKTNDVLDHIQPRVIKVMDGGLSDNKIADARGHLPAGAIVVGRVYFENPPVPTDDNLTTYNPAAAAQQTFDAMRQDMDKMGGLVDVWEGWNEYPVDENGPLEPRHWKKAEHFSNFTIEMAARMHAAGHKYAAYSFSTGNPNHLEIWKTLELGVMASDYLALHEYIFPGADYQTPDFSMCKRHQLVYQALSPAARAHVKMLITECGADLAGIPGADGGGYKKNIGDDKYWDWLRQYDEILLQAPYVVGATIYTYGATKDWVTYDISGSFAKLMANRIPALPDTPDPVTPIDVTPPPTPPAHPSILPLAQVREQVQSAITKLNASDGNGAHDILTRVVNPWFYESAPQNSTDLANAQAHTAARWWSEEATRRIEANKLTEARDILTNNVLSWLSSSGPSAIGILGLGEAPAPKKKSAKKAAKKKSAAKRTQARAKKKTAKKKSK